MKGEEIDYKMDFLDVGGTSKEGRIVE